MGMFLSEVKAGLSPREKGLSAKKGKEGQEGLYDSSS